MARFTLPNLTRDLSSPRNTHNPVLPIHKRQAQIGRATRDAGKGGGTLHDFLSPWVHDGAMLRLLPAQVHRGALRTVHALRLRWWRVSKRTVRGCNVIATNDSGHVLLVRHTYHNRETWMLPGGGLAPNESPLTTAARELAEETGCILLNPAHLCTVTLNRTGWTNLIELVAGETRSAPCPDGREIEEARFFDPHALPAQTSGPVRAMISRWLGIQNGSSD